MPRKRKALALFSIGIALLLPVFTYAQIQPSGAGLVPCGVTQDSPLSTEKDVGVATECEACHLVQLTQNIIHFLIGLAVSIAVLMFAWAGILFFTSNANPEKINKGKRIFGQTLFGFLLALCAWIIVNTLLFILIDQQQFPQSTWFEVECAKSRAVVADKEFGQIVLGAIGNVESIPLFKIQDGTRPDGQYSCPAGFTYDTTARMCLNGQGGAEEPDFIAPLGSGAFTPNSEATVDFGSCGGEGSIGSRIMRCATLYADSRVSSAKCSPNVDGGNLACACMVNKILNGAGILSIDADSVPDMVAALKAGRGRQISIQSAQPGDIVFWQYTSPRRSHVGICATPGCTQVYSNSSSQAVVRLTTSDYLGVDPSSVYRINDF